LGFHGKLNLLKTGEKENSFKFEGKIDILKVIE